MLKDIRLGVYVDFDYVGKAYSGIVTSLATYGRIGITILDSFENKHEVSINRKNITHVHKD